MSKHTLTVLLSQADADRFGFPDAGHSTIAFDTPAEVERARTDFDRFRAAGFVAFEVSPDACAPENGGSLQLGRRLNEFDERAESIYLFRRMVGG